MTLASSYEEIYDYACELYLQNMPWNSFFREILGREGLVRRKLRTPESRSEFDRTETSARIHEMLTKLREQQAKRTAPKEPVDTDELTEPQERKDRTHVITIRLPKSLHEALRSEAHEHKTSMNQLCISKLLQFIDAELVPSETPREE